ncbi:MAG TPA: GNAT family N-acetyltransferase [Patescibacteria group bacterium]|nr:GNAT family N-acetyltransferase [Patescibacteria group bacterium]
MSNVSIERIPRGGVDFDLARALETVGYEAWLNSLDRYPDQIRHMFNPINEVHIAQKQKEYAAFAQGGRIANGVLRVAVAREGNVERIAGFAMARNDVSGLLPIRALKHVVPRLPRPFKRPLAKVDRKEYAWVAQVNVLPEYQDQGIGKQLLGETLEPFRPDQVPVVYVFAENAVVWHIARNLGFNLDPGVTIQEEHDRHLHAEYFGEHSQPAEQFRFTHQSVDALQVILQETA